MVFSPDDENRGLMNARPPSDEVLDALLKKVEADNLNSEIESLGREQKRASFEVVRVPLGWAAEENYVVHGKPPMIGADCEWFWIVRVRKGKAQVLLFANGLALKLRGRVEHGYRDIDVAWASAASVSDRLYRYDGLTYKVVRAHTERQKP